VWAGRSNQCFGGKKVTATFNWKMFKICHNPEDHINLLHFQTSSFINQVIFFVMQTVVLYPLVFLITSLLLKIFEACETQIIKNFIGF